MTPHTLSAIALVSTLLSPLAFAQAPGAASESLLYITSPKGGPGHRGGLQLCKWEPATGKITPTDFSIDVAGGGFAALHPAGRFLYVVGAPVEKNPAQGSITALAIDGGTHELRVLNAQPAGGKGPAHICLDPAGRFALTACYGGGQTGVVAINGDGTVGAVTDSVQHTGTGPDEKRQKEPHPHMVDFDPTGRLVLVPDLGTDKVVLYELDDSTGKLAAHDPAFAAVPPGGGPRHVAWHPTGKFAYVVNEMGASVTAFAYNAQQGALTAIGTVSSVPPGYTGIKWAGGVAVHPSGKILYASNRGLDTIARFSLDPATGKLALLDQTPTGGKVPRFFCLDPSGRFLIVGNQESDTIVTFRVDPGTGELTQVGEPLKTPAPYCVTFVK